MTYPQTKITRKIRLTIMISLIVTFFVISPIIIMYTAGYRYDFSKHEIKQTGVLSIDALPKNLTVYLNGVKIDKKIPVWLPNRAPGNYEVRLVKDGYQEWIKNVDIASKKTTYIKEITLFKKNSPIMILDELKNIINFQASFNGQYIIITTKENNIFETYLYETNTKILSSISRIKTETEPVINWSPFNNYFVIQTANKQQDTIQIFDATDQTNTKTYIYNKLVNYQWAKNTSVPSIYIQNNGQIILATTDSEKLVTDIDNDIQAWHVQDENNVWLYKNNIIKNGSSEYHLGSAVKNIIDINTNRLIYKTDNDVKIIKFFDSQIQENNSIPTQQIIYNYQTGEWITWSWWELWTIYDNGNTELLNRTGEKMVIINPLDQYGLLLIANENKMIGFNPGYYLSHELFSNAQIFKTAVDINVRKIFFWGKVTDKTGVFELPY
ncbi:MAG: PEGA domain-containing protein [Candidatus Magasanikiibacteriota bacterium]